MEELFAYSLLFCQGYDFWDLYEEKLDSLFLKYPDNEEYFYLEELKNQKVAALHIISKMSESPFDIERFGRTLMKQIGEIYTKSELTDFAPKMLSLWKTLPRCVYQEEPFLTLSYADDCLSYGDEKQCRNLYEQAIHYYD